MESERERMNKERLDGAQEHRGIVCFPHLVGGMCLIHASLLLMDKVRLRGERRLPTQCAALKITQDNRGVKPKKGN